MELGTGSILRLVSEWVGVPEGGSPTSAFMPRVPAGWQPLPRQPPACPRHHEGSEQKVARRVSTGREERDRLLAHTGPVLSLNLTPIT